METGESFLSDPLVIGREEEVQSDAASMDAGAHDPDAVTGGVQYNIKEVEDVREVTNNGMTCSVEAPLTEMMGLHVLDSDYKPDFAMEETGLSTDPSATVLSTQQVLLVKLVEEGTDSTKAVPRVCLPSTNIIMSDSSSEGDRQPDDIVTMAAAQTGLNLTEGHDENPSNIHEKIVKMARAYVLKSAVEGCGQTTSTSSSKESDAELIPVTDFPMIPVTVLNYQDQACPPTKKRKLLECRRGPRTQLTYVQK